MKKKKVRKKLSQKVRGVHPVPKNNKSGTVWYLRYWDAGKHRTIPRHLYTPFTSEKAALDWIENDKAVQEFFLKAEALYQTKSSDGTRETKPVIPISKLSRGLKRIQTLREFTDQNKDLKKYINWIKKHDSPNSWESNQTYMEKYVFPFFLGIKRLSNYNLWYKDFHNFQLYLENEATSEKTGKLLSYSSKNHCIRCLNSFLKHMVRLNKIEPWHATKCTSFPHSKVVKEGGRGWKDVIKRDGQFEEILSRLEYSRDYFRILFFTGMRFNELNSLPFSAVRANTTRLPKMFLEFADRTNKTIYGYILLENQIAGKLRSRSRNKKTGEVRRKPLKSKTDDSPKNFRIIPIWDDETWKILEKNKIRASKERLAKKFNSSRDEDYFLLDIEENRLRREYRKKVPDKKLSLHCCRGSYITYLAGELNDCGMPIEEMVRAITGITSDALEHYLHMYERMMLEASKDEDSSLKNYKPYRPKKRSTLRRVK